MNDPSSNCELLLRYLDNALSPEERARVEKLLRVDRAARDMFRDLAEQAVVIADVNRVHQANVSQLAQSNTDPPSRPQSNLTTFVKAVLALAAVLLFAMTVRQLLPSDGGELKIITVTAIDGPTQWTGSAGRITDELIVGSELPGGTIELMSAASWIEFEFRDQSRVILSGQSEVIISEQQHKELRLKHGSLSANVQPQPAGRPMLVHTPTAELKIIGTQFNVDALADSTRLAVNEGRVRLKRLVDGKEVDVPAHHEVRASMQDENGMSVNERSEAVSVWKSDLKNDVVSGKWISDHWMLGMKLKDSVASGEMNEAAAIRAYKNAATLQNESGSVWAEASPFGSLVALSVPQSSTRPVVLGANTIFRIRGRLHSRVSVTFGISTRKKDGGFAGKYSDKFPDSDLRSNGNAFEIELPITKLQQSAKSGDSLIGKELSDWWCVADSMSGKLEITSVELVEQ